MTRKYLKDHDLLAVPYDKGVGICIMKKEVYHDKMNTIINLPQFEKYVKPRKNAKHPVLKEQERIRDALKDLLEEEKISEKLYEELVPRGSQPARLYGLAKVHKKNTPVRPVLSMPGSAYHKVAEYVAGCLKNVPQCKINASSKQICDKLKDIMLDKDEEVISYDVVSLYTNVPVLEAITVCADLLYNIPYDQRPAVDKDTFILLAKIASCDVLMSTHDGFYWQRDGLAMGSPPAPHFANGWLSQFENSIKGESRLYFRYMDDILKERKCQHAVQELNNINALHPNLKFTEERENEHQDLPVLDMKIHHDHEKGTLSSTWYNKPTDTGLIMNYHALAPKRYKRSVVSGFVYRIHRACSSWENFHTSMEKAKRILEKNQYPPTFYEPVIRQALSDILGEAPEQPSTSPAQNTNTVKRRIMIQYRGKCSEEYARALHKINAPVTVVMTLRKLKTVLPSLKPSVEKLMKSGVIYNITCPGCSACYVGQTDRHLMTRLYEHIHKAGPMKTHIDTKCKTTLTDEDVDILHTTSRGENYLLTLEALYIRERKPVLNTKDEYRRRELVIKL